MAVLFILCLFLLPPALCQIDTSPYSQLLSSISSTEQALQTARRAQDVQGIIDLTNQLLGLRENEASPQMLFLKEYGSVLLSLEEADYLVLQIPVSLGSEGMLSVKGQVESLKADIFNIESIYNAGSYASALEQLRLIESELAYMPASISSAAEQAVDSLRKTLETTSTVTPSALSMLDTAKENFGESKLAYGRAAASLLKFDKDIAIADIALADFAFGRERAEDAFTLVSKAVSNETESFDSIKYILVLVPLILIFGLLAYFYFLFKKSVFKCSLSRTTLKAGIPDKIERRLDFVNNSKSSAFVKVTDFPPIELHPSGFSYDPENIDAHDLTWSMNLEPGQRVSIKYELTSDILEAGKKILFPSATLLITHSEDSTQKKLVEKTFEITVA